MSNSDWTVVFRERLEVLRARYGVSKAELARRTGLPARTLENYFKGQKPSVDALLAISEGTNADLDWLIGTSKEAKGMQTDLIGEATYLVLSRLFTEMTSRQASGDDALADGKVLGMDPARLAARIEEKVVRQFLQLRDEYALGSAELAAKTRRESHNDDVSAVEPDDPDITPN